MGTHWVSIGFLIRALFSGTTTLFPVIAVSVAALVIRCLVPVHLAKHGIVNLSGPLRESFRFNPEAIVVANGLDNFSGGHIIKSSK